MKKLINSINNPGEQLIHPICLVATILCGMQALSGVGNLSITFYLLTSYKDAMTQPPTFLDIIIQLATAAIPVCLCVLAFRGMTRPVQKGSLIAAGACLLVLAALLVQPIVTLGGTSIYMYAAIAALLAAAAAAVLIIFDKGKNLLIIGLLIVFVAAVYAVTYASGDSVRFTALDAFAAAMGSAAVRLASQDPKMA